VLACRRGEMEVCSIDHKTLVRHLCTNSATLSLFPANTSFSVATGHRLNIKPNDLDADFETKKELPAVESQEGPDVTA